MMSTRDASEEEAQDDVSGTRESNSLASPARFNQLVLDNLEFVWRILRRYGVSEPEVDDATQQVFIVANEKLARIHPGSERPFLLAVAGRVASHARRAAHRRAAAQERFSQDDTEGPQLPEQPSELLEARDLLDRVLESMPTEVRHVFVLFELEGFTIDEVAKLLDVPRGTVASRVKRARFLFQRGVRLRSYAGGKS